MSSRLPRSTPEQQEVSSAGLLALVDALESIDELHSLMVVTGGAVVAEGWWDPYTADRPHQLFSVSKTFTAIAVGFAVAEGLLTVDDLVLDHLGDRGPAIPGEHLARMRLRHLLTMTTGHHEDPSDRVFDHEDWVGTFLALPVEHEPGTHFVYNTSATYLLSAIVQQVSGERLLDYLTPRLPEPLGIVGATWEHCPRGVDAGGFGLTATTEDLAVLGQLLLDDGVWDGRQILPPGWVEEATRVHTATTGHVPDWEQGYGYQMWHSRHGSFRGDGAFGQFCLVLPEQQTVVAITGGTLDMQGVLDAVWTHLLPAVGRTGPRTRRLAERLATLRLRPPVGALPEAGEWSATIEPNLLGIREIRARAAEGHTVVEVTTTGRVPGTRGLPDLPGEEPGARRLTIRAGAGVWQRGEVAIPWDLPARPARRGRTEPVVASAVVATDGGLHLTVRLLETPFVAQVEIARDGDRVTVAGRLNVSFGPTELPPLHGRLTP